MTRRTVPAAETGQPPQIKRKLSLRFYHGHGLDCTGTFTISRKP